MVKLTEAEKLEIQEKKDKKHRFHMNKLKLKNTLHYIKLDENNPDKSWIPDKFKEKQWTHITDPDLFLEIWGQPFRKIASQLYKYYAIVHETDSYFSSGVKFKKMKQDLLDSYGDKLLLYFQKKGIPLKDVNNKLTIYEISDHIFDAFNDVITFNIKDGTYNKSDKQILSVDGYKDYSRKMLQDECVYFKLTSKSGNIKELQERLESKRIELSSKKK